MLTVERKLGKGKTLEKVIPDYVNHFGLTGAAEKLGITKQTLSYWMLRFNIRYHHVAASPGETVYIESENGSRVSVESYRR